MNDDRPYFDFYTEISRQKIWVEVGLEDPRWQ